MTTSVIVVGDGPGGLSAALFLAKGGISVTVYGEDKTAMHWALLKNYLGRRRQWSNQCRRRVCDWTPGPAHEEPGHHQRG
jgi:thioredoxin reductase